MTSSGVLYQPLSIGILGSRGIPNQYGGYEQFVQHLAPALVRRGHRVTVYQSSRHPYREGYWQGVELYRGWDPEDHLGSFGQFIYDWNCLQDARRRPYHVLLHLGYTSDAIWSWRWPRGMVHLVHMDGLEWMRAKYSPLVQRFLHSMEARAVSRGDGLIADSPAIAAYIWETYRQPSTFIPYGAEIPEQVSLEPLTAFGLKPGGYRLCISRLVPENNLEMIIQGVLALDDQVPLLIVGDTRTPYGAFLQQRYESDRVRFAGSLFEKDQLDSLRSFCRIYLHGHSVGGTNPSLLEAMACSSPIGAHDNPFNRAVLGAEAIYFSSAQDLSRNLASVQAPEKWMVQNREKIATTYSWESIVNAYESLFLKTRKRETVMQNRRYSKVHRSRVTKA